MIWRLLLTAFALYWGWNGIQMFSCDYVTWSGGNATCWQDTLWGATGQVSGPVMGSIVLVAVVAVLSWLWVWPIMRANRQVHDEHSLP